MTSSVDHQTRKAASVDDSHRQFRAAQLVIAGAATLAALAMLNSARPGVAESSGAAGPVRLADHAVALSAPARSAFGGQLPQTAPHVGAGGFAADPGDPGWNTQPDPGSNFPTDPGWSSQSDPGWNADPGWDFQLSP